MMTNCCCRACVSNILRHNCRQVIRRYMTMCFKLPAMHGVIMICRYGRKWNSVGQCWCVSPDSYVMHRHICGHRMSVWDVCRSIYIHISWGDWYWWSVGSGLYYQNLSDSSFQKKSVHLHYNISIRKRWRGHSCCSAPQICSWSLSYFRSQ